MKTIKCVIVGDENIGKTSLLTKYNNQTYIDKYFPTVFDTFHHSSFLQDSQALLLELWDTGGSKKFDRYRPLSYTNIDVAIICFSIVSPESFENVELKWYPEIRKYLPDVPICLVGLKHDLLEDKETRDKLDKDDKSPILFFEGVELAQQIGAYKYCDCSAKTGYKIDNVFNIVVYAVQRHQFLKDKHF